VVAEHLRWLWGRCDRADGWMRSHLPNGAVKDRAFQADQQLYPLLELLDYREAAGAWPEASPGRADWGEVIAETWRALPVDPELGLVAGEENPADDPASLPYLLSTQILLWHTATRLGAHAGELGLAAPALAKTADTAQAAIRDRFACPGPFGGQWAYETDGRGRSRRYHDANDLPTALAPLWGLCPPDDPQWSATMRFALDPANPGWSPGRWGGLGSAHTPGTWPLGDIQEWVAASLLGDTGRAERTLVRLLAVAAPDGLLPETYHSGTGRWLARPWFAWPGATLAVLALGAWTTGSGAASGR
jgi:meiotically up-regulated gene 157 (Mug157) protein